jgi:predicted cobalt transporter CbtA
MSITLGSALKYALLAGLAAALVVSVFHLIVTEPVIDQAIGLEEQMNPSHGDEEPIVSREMQKAGLVLGLLLYGAILALLYGVVYHLTQGWLPATTAWGRGLLLAVMGYLSVALLPFLKYPANPPGVGDPETISFRQGLYVGLLVLSVAAVWLAAAIARFLRTRGASNVVAWLSALGFIVVFGAVAFALLPANPDPVEMPSDLLAVFRTLSLVGLTLFWAVLGIAFAALSRRSQAPVAS